MARAAVIWRCLVLPDIFARTWTESSLPSDGTPPDDAPFWPEASRSGSCPDAWFLSLAEAYWDPEWTLQHQGFDVTYDKRLYDRLHAQDVTAVRDHLRADADFRAQVGPIPREPRRAEGGGRLRPLGTPPAAATISFLVPGFRLFHQGQLEGAAIRASVHLSRRDRAGQFHRGGVLRPLARDPATILNCGAAAGPLRECRRAWAENASAEQFLAFSWEGPAGERLLIAVNYASEQGQCYVSLPPEVFAGKSWTFRDLTGPFAYQRNSDDLVLHGLYLDLPPWGTHGF